MTGVDRVSGLPDAILHHILSFLPAAEVVRTSTLSKRWRTLWASAPHLLLRASDFGRGEFGMKRFKRFVSAVLLLRETCNIHSLELAWSAKSGTVECDLSLVVTWISVVVWRNVQLLHLKDLVLYAEVPRILFTCQSLVTLKLEGCLVDLRALNAIRLGRLTTLELKGTDFTADSAGKLISGCPLLQHLIMECCRLSQVLDISSGTLETLILWFNDMNDSEVTVSAPALLSLELRDLEARTCTLRNLTSLVRLYVDVNKKLGSLRMLDGLSNVHELELSDMAVEYLFGEIVNQEQLPTLSELKKLKLSICLSNVSIQAITCILQCSSNLKEFAIKNRMISKFSRKNWLLKESLETFLGSLNSVQIDGFTIKPSTEAFISFLCSKAKSLEEMLLSPYND